MPPHIIGPMETIGYVILILGTFGGAAALIKLIFQAGTIRAEQTSIGQQVLALASGAEKRDELLIGMKQREGRDDERLIRLEKGVERMVDEFRGFGQQLAPLLEAIKHLPTIEQGVIEREKRVQALELKLGRLEEHLTNGEKHDDKQDETLTRLENFERQMTRDLSPILLYVQAEQRRTVEHATPRPGG